MREGARISPPPRSEWSPEMSGRAGVFVSLHEHDELRGCIGTFLPTRENVADEVIDNAVSAATRDPRFFPVLESELADLEISVDVLSAPESIDSPAELDPEKYGVIVTDVRGTRRGLLLPNLPQVTTVQDQVSIAKEKAYIAPSEPVKLYRFKVDRYH